MNAAAIAQAREAMRAAKCAVALTGAGISVESGIPDFRSAGGLWERYPPEVYAEIDSYIHNPDRVWRLWQELGQTLAAVAPNPGHFALARLEAQGPLKAVITQNIDGLHQRAGSRKVIEYHGNAAELVCLECQRREPIGRALESDTAPRCSCRDGALMKPAVVFFGELIPPDAAADAEYWVETCDLMLIAGTSATVYPCAGLPAVARSHGATIIECNLEPTAFTSRLTDVFVQGRTGETLPLLAG
jgi:NAD-dependent deacetylase